MRVTVPDHRRERGREPGVGLDAGDGLSGDPTTGAAHVPLRARELPRHGLDARRDPHRVALPALDGRSQRLRQVRRGHRHLEPAAGRAGRRVLRPRRHHADRWRDRRRRRCGRRSDHRPGRHRRRLVRGRQHGTDDHLLGPGDRRDVRVGRGATPGCTATDAGSGPNGCSVVTTGGTTSGVGTRTVVATATDKAGNTSTSQRSYRVIYRFAGFSSPSTRPGRRACSRRARRWQCASG